MALLVETGAGIVGANSYLTVEELRAFATDRGLTLPTDPTAVEALLVQAADFLDTKQYIGTRLTDEQGLSWPRSGTKYQTTDDPVVYIIPANLKRAQCFLAIEAVNGSLTPAVRPGKYVKTKVDVLYVQFASDADRAAGIRMRNVDDLLAPLLSVGGSRSIVTVRA